MTRCSPSDQCSGRSTGHPAPPNAALLRRSAYMSGQTKSSDLVRMGVSAVPSRMTVLNCDERQSRGKHAHGSRGRPGCLRVASQLRIQGAVAGLLRVRLTCLSRDEVSREGCRYAEEVPAGVQA
jgi:hypothetical protein